MSALIGLLPRDSCPAVRIVGSPHLLTSIFMYITYRMFPPVLLSINENTGNGNLLAGVKDWQLYTAGILFAAAQKDLYS
jgi:hypothetical protein